MVHTRLLLSYHRRASHQLTYSLGSVLSRVRGGVRLHCQGCTGGGPARELVLLLSCVTCASARTRRIRSIRRQSAADHLPPRAGSIFTGSFAHSVLLACAFLSGPVVAPSCSVCSAYKQGESSLTRTHPTHHPHTLSRSIDTREVRTLPARLRARSSVYPGLGQSSVRTPATWRCIRASSRETRDRR
jgi:hypothetical protein